MPEKKSPWEEGLLSGPVRGQWLLRALMGLPPKGILPTFGEHGVLLVYGQKRQRAKNMQGKGRRSEAATKTSRGVGEVILCPVSMRDGSFHLAPSEGGGGTAPEGPTKDRGEIGEPLGCL